MVRVIICICLYLLYAKDVFAEFDYYVCFIAVYYVTTFLNLYYFFFYFERQKFVLLHVITNNHFKPGTIIGSA